MSKIGDEAHPQGKPLEHDPNFKGPVADRSCTDVICCFLFLIFIIGWAIISGMAFIYGNPERLVNPTDSQGRTCGANKPGAYDLSTKPYLYFFDLTQCVSYATVFEGCRTPQVCVERCPNYYFSYLELQPYALQAQPLETFATVMQKSICLTDDIKNSIQTFDQMQSAINLKQCAAYVVATTAVLGRCIPNIIVNAGTALSASSNASMDNLTAILGSGDGKVPTSMQLGNSSGFVKTMVEAKAIVEKILSDLAVSWWQILAMLLITAIIAFLWIILMRIFGGLMIWLSIFAVVIVLAAGAVFCGYKYKMLRDAGAVNNYYLTLNIELYFEMPDTFLCCGIALIVLLVIVLLILLFLRKRIQIAIALITETSKAIGNMLSSLFFPVIPFVLHILVFVLWASVAIWLQSWGEENCRRIGVSGSALNLNGTNGNGSKCSCDLINTTNEPFCTFVNYTKNSEYVIYYQAYNLFGFFWLACFVSGLADLALAGAFASHYWAFRKPDDVPSFPVIRGVARAIRYHLGSIAFGSLLLATVKFIRALLDYLDKKLSTAQNSVAKFIMLCLKCCFWCLEKFLKFLTRNAYVMIAIYGKNFCTSARDSFMLLARNIVRVVVLDKVTDFLLFLGKFGITIGMGILSFYYFSGKWEINDLITINLNYYFVPVVIVTVGSYFICDAFFDVYEMAVDTTFLCFLEDSERNDGSPEKPYFMSKELLKILGKENNFHAEKPSYN